VNEPPTDTALLERIRDSDTEAFRILFEQYQPLLFRHVFFQTREADAAHDIVQETFIRVWDHRRSLDPLLSFPAYILRISGNLVLDEYRRRKRREKLDPEIFPHGKTEEDDPLKALEGTLLEEELAIVIGRLPDRCRAVFLLSRIEGKSNREIALMLGISVRTVEHQINHALKAIRKRLAAKGWKM
jgi:RNA polymerase sigma-70 factor, ECF subfamily